VTTNIRSTIRLILFVSFLSASFQSFAQAPTFPIQSFNIDGEIPLSDSQIEKVLGIFGGDDKGLSDLQSAAKALEEAIRAQGHIFYRVVVPPQKLASGKVTLKVLRFTINKLEVTGNNYFNEENIKGSLPNLKVGESPSSLDLQKTLQIANNHPAKRTTILMKQSRDVPDAIDAELQVRDVEPQQIFMSLNNTGTPDTGNERLSLGYQYSNLFNLDHAVTLSYTTSPGHWEDVEQKGVFYRIPFYKLGGVCRYRPLIQMLIQGWWAILMSVAQVPFMEHAINMHLKN